MGGSRDVRESTVRDLWVHARVIRMQVEVLLMWPRACWGDGWKRYASGTTATRSGIDSARIPAQ
jgi:hypothetical protein